MSDTQHDLVADGYDAVYAALPRSPTLRRIWREQVLGPEYPEAFAHISLLTLPELRRLAAELRLSANATFVDLACGAGGPGLWVAREAGAQLRGIDVSAVGIAYAAARAADLGLSMLARFTVGTFADTGLETACVDAAMSVDALQYAPDKRAALGEAARILRPGGRFVFTAFELDAKRAAGLPVIGADSLQDYYPLLGDAGFAIDAYEETPGWQQRLTATYEAILAAMPALTEEMGEAAATALAMEASLTLERQPYRRRVLAVTTRS